jgi:hypothetical protein
MGVVEILQSIITIPRGFDRAVSGAGTGPSAAPDGCQAVAWGRLDAGLRTRRRTDHRSITV